tara:strand:- start:981 stop:1199 length:219 start_codon:yes stop_codon:yes gene_type:complete
MENMSVEEKNEEISSELELPAGIKTETVLKYLGEVSGALSGIANDINQTIVNVISAGEDYIEKENASDDADE